MHINWQTDDCWWGLLIIIHQKRKKNEIKTEADCQHNKAWEKIKWFCFAARADEDISIFIYLFYLFYLLLFLNNPNFKTELEQQQLERRVSYLNISSWKNLYFEVLVNIKLIVDWGVTVISTSSEQTNTHRLSDVSTTLKTHSGPWLSTITPIKMNF